MTGIRRRGFLAGTVAAGVAACTSDADEPDRGSTTSVASTSSTNLPVPKLPGDPFTLGVASGDPLPDAVVLWTRLLPSEGVVPDQPVPVRWELATNESFHDLVASGVVTTDAGLANSVHADATDLQPDTRYWYRFIVGDWTSPVGRTRTAPAAGGSPELVRIGVANCQAWQSGYYSAHRHLAEEEDIAAVVFLGDYIYELESSIAARPHGMDPPTTLEGYRRLYELNNTDPDLRASLAAHPWIVTWDDHEVEDNYADGYQGLVGRSMGQSPEAFHAKRAAAYQAWWEHMPVRTGPPADGALRIHRGFAFGDLVDMAVVDTRQYRTPQPEGPGAGPRPLGGGPQPPRAFAEDAQMLGDEQEAWLLDRLRSSEARWTVLAQQSVMAEMNRRPDLPGGAFSLDSWDGYVAARQRLMDVVSGADGAAPVRDFVSLGGDIHTSAVTDLHADPTDPATAVVGTEFVGPSVSALELLDPVAVAGARSQPHVRLYDIERRGYLLVDFTPGAATATYRWVDDALRPDSSISTGTVWRVEAGRPGAVEV